MSRSTSRGVALLFGVMWLVAAMVSHSWLVGVRQDYSAQIHVVLVGPGANWLGNAARIIGALAGLLSLMSLLLPRWVPIASSASLTALCCGLGFEWAVTGEHAVGAGLVVFLVAQGSLFLAAVLAEPAEEGQENSVGESVDGEKDGRQLVYRKGKLVRIETWERGTLVRSDPYGDQEEMK